MGEVTKAENIKADMHRRIKPTAGGAEKKIKKKDQKKKNKKKNIYITSTQALTYFKVL